MSQSASFGVGHDFVPADDEMIEQHHVDQLQGLFEALCHPVVGQARFRHTRWVVVGDDDAGGVELQCLAGDFAGVDRRRVDRFILASYWLKLHRCCVDMADRLG